MDYNDVPLMRVSHLSKHLGGGCSHCRSRSVKLQGDYCPKCRAVCACQDIGFDVYDGEILDTVGESDSGKSTVMQCLYFDQKVTEGSCTIRTYKNGAANVFELTAQQQRYIRNHVPGMVYQSPYLELKTNFSSMGNIAKKLIATGKHNVKTMNERGKELLNAVRIPVHRMKEEPRKFSDGVRQRVQIAGALSNNPSILLLDKVTTGLDLSVQANILDLTKKMQREPGVFMLVVSHGLGMARILTDRTVVMPDGEIIEQELTDQVIGDPQHPYTQQLIYSLLQGGHHDYNHKWKHRTGT